MQFETIETERLLLKKLGPAEFDHLFANHSEEEICQILGLLNHEEFLKEKSRVEGGYQTYDRTIASFILVSKSTGEAIGRSGFHNWYKDHKRAELGYVIYEDQNKNKGYMS
ncbi:MAG: GNAT family N-acetyltransferase, partial [Crocinitomicaceae bacterium]|nr:GNAT family N-acetyltransferase [Crocinitomicaceae bacterium]